MNEHQQSGPPLAERLSPAGQARERAMRGDLLRRVDQTRRHRHTLHIGAGAAALAILLVTATLSIPGRTKPAPPFALAPHAPEQPVPPRSIPSLHITIVSNDPTILARLTIPSTPPSLARDLTDDQLLSAFRADGFSVALVRIGGRLELLAN